MKPKLKLIPGNGVVARSKRFLTWSSEDTMDILSYVETAEDDAFKSLAALVLQKEFSLGPFVVVDLDRNSCFLFGAATLETSSQIFNGTTTSTWIETTVDTQSSFAVNADEQAPDEITDLVEGTVRAGGWVMSAHSQTEQVVPTAVAPQIEDQPANEESPSEAGEPDVQSPIDAGSGAVDLFDDDTEDIDETDDLVDQFDADLTVVANSQSGPPHTLLIPEIGVLDKNTEPLGHETDTELPPLRTPGTPRLKKPESDQSDSPDEVQTPTVQVRFDDGQETSIDLGIYVGRNPTKHGVPPRYEAITIRSEHVSRVHWELDLSSDIPRIRDLGSMSGLLLGHDGAEQIEIPPNGEAELPSSTRVEFADRWALIEFG